MRKQSPGVGPRAIKFRSIHEWNEVLDVMLLQNAERNSMAIRCAK
jgi:hypothetical protein